METSLGLSTTSDYWERLIGLMEFLRHSLRQCPDCPTDYIRIQHLPSIRLASQCRIKNPQRGKSL